MGQFPNDEMPQHLVKLARENTSPIISTCNKGLMITQEKPKTALL